MTILATTTPLFVRQAVVPHHAPIRTNGEHQFARLLQARGIRYRYEAFFYPLSFYSGGALASGFTPDFWLPESERWPELHIELTWVDRDQARLKPQQRRQAVARLRLKKQKIGQLRALYGIETLLIMHRQWTCIKKRRQRLDELIDEMLLQREHPSVMQLSAA